MFKNSSYDINLDLERVKGEVIVHVQSQYLADMEQIIIERSGDNMQNFTACKTIDVASQKIVDGDYLRNSDRFPLPATARFSNVASWGDTTMLVGSVAPDCIATIDGSILTARLLTDGERLHRDGFEASTR